MDGFVLKYESNFKSNFNFKEFNSLFMRIDENSMVNAVT